MKKISKKENPVPSLTKEEIEYIQENLLLNNSRSNIGESILKKLNGVETNNEQPDISFFSRYKD